MRIVICLAVLFGMVGPAHAVPEFRERFLEMYTDQTQLHDPWTAKINNAKCAVCHAGPRTKQLNIYGQQLQRYLDAGMHRKDHQRIDATLRAVGKEHVDPQDPLSPTFGDRLRRGLLPATGR